MTLIFVDYHVPGENNGICAYRKHLLEELMENEHIAVITLLVRCTYLRHIKTEYKKKNILIQIPHDLVCNGRVHPEDKQVAQILKQQIKEPPAILHLNWMNHALFGEVLKKHIETKVVLTKHCVSWRELIIKNYPLFYHIENSLLSRKKVCFLAKRLLSEEMSFFMHIDHIITVTNDARNILTQLYGIPPHKVCCIHNGIAFNSPITDYAKDIRLKYGFNENEYIIIFAGTLSVFKGLLELYRIIVRLHENGCKCRLIVCGSGNFQMALSSVPSKISSYVTFTGNIDRKKLCEFMTLADVGIVPSLQEQCSYVALEMIQCRLPIITSNVPGLREIMPEGNEFYLPIQFTPSKYNVDIDFGARLIEKMLIKSSFSKQHSAILMDRVKKLFNKELMVKKTLSVYEQLIHKKEPSFITKGTDPLISVIIPCYNSANYISECIKSVIKQDSVNIEILIIDDSSSDNTIEIVRDFIKKDKRIHLMRNRSNRGIVYCLNKGIKSAKGKYIARIDSDDTMLKDRLYKQCSFMENNPEYAMVGCNVIVTDEEGYPLRYVTFPETHEEISRMKFFMNPFLHSGVMIRKKIFERIRYRTKYLHCEDYDLWLRICKQHKVFNLQEYLSTYRINSKSISVGHKKEQYKNVISLLIYEIEENGIEITQEEYEALACAIIGIPSESWSKHQNNLKKLFHKTNSIYCNNGLTDEFSFDLFFNCIKQRKL